MRKATMFFILALPLAIAGYLNAPEKAETNSLAATAEAAPAIDFEREISPLTAKPIIAKAKAEPIIIAAIAPSAPPVKEAAPKIATATAKAEKAEPKKQAAHKKTPITAPEPPQEEATDKNDAPIKEASAEKTQEGKPEPASEASPKAETKEIAVQQPEAAPAPEAKQAEIKASSKTIKTEEAAPVAASSGKPVLAGKDAAAIREPAIKTESIHRQMITESALSPKIISTPRTTTEPKTSPSITFPRSINFPPSVPVPPVPMFHSPQNRPYRDMRPPRSDAYGSSSHRR